MSHFFICVFYMNGLMTPMQFAKGLHTAMPFEIKQDGDEHHWEALTDWDKDGEWNYRVTVDGRVMVVKTYTEQPFLVDTPVKHCERRL